MRPRKKIFLYFLTFFFFSDFSFFDIKMYNSWRIAYFFNLYIIYFATFLFFFFTAGKDILGLKKTYSHFFIFFNFILIVRLIIYHPTNHFTSI